MTARYYSGRRLKRSDTNRGKGRRIKLDGRCSWCKEDLFQSCGWQRMKTRRRTPQVKYAGGHCVAGATNQATLIEWRRWSVITDSAGVARCATRSCWFWLILAFLWRQYRFIDKAATSTHRSPLTAHRDYKPVDGNQVMNHFLPPLLCWSTSPVAVFYELWNRARSTWRESSVHPHGGRCRDISRLKTVTAPVSKSVELNLRTIKSCLILRIYGEQYTTHPLTIHESYFR